MKNTKQTLESIKSHGYNLDFGTVFNHAFECYKKIAVNAGAAILLLGLVLGILVAGLVLGIIAVGISLENLQEFNLANFSVAGIIIYAIVIILLTCLGTPLNAGLIKMAQNASKNKEVSLGNAFEYYNNSYFKEIFIATLILTTFTTLTAVGLELVEYKFLGAILNLLVSFLTFLTIPLIIFGNLKPMDAIQGSIVIISRQFFIILGLVIVAGLFSILGIFAFCIGIFFTIPLMNAMTYSIYASIINDDENEDLEEENIEPEIVIE